MENTFEHFKLNKQLLNALDDLGFTEPTPVQEKVIPRGLGGADIIGVAQTGTGKTAAYLLPILMKLKYAQEISPRAVIFTPTRELAIQVSKMANDLSKYTDLRFITLFGGIGPKTQIEELKKGTDIIITTSGRFMDLYLKGHIDTTQIKTLVLDEADRMMDMGFMPQLRQILEVIPRKRQNMLFSATFSERVDKLSAEFLEFPEKIEITKSATASVTIDQELYYLPNLRSKIAFIEYLYKTDPSITKAIIFARTKGTADNIFKYIERTKLSPVRVIHANKGQNSRINAINQFESGEINTLVSTDVTARGMDITDVSHVINFDVPIMYEDYVHRIGRTGRAKKLGKAITLATESEHYHINEIENLIRTSIPIKTVPEEVDIFETPSKESQEMAREIDRQKRYQDKDFKGAFHEKKEKNKYRSK